MAVSNSHIGLRAGQEPVPDERKPCGFWRAKEFTISGKSKRLHISSEVEVRVKREKGTEWKENQEFCDIAAEIWLTTDEKCIGYFTGKVFRLREYPYSPMDIFYAFDALDQDGCDFASDVAVENEVDLEDFCDGQNFAIIDRIEVLPEWSGHGIGISALRAIVSYLARIDDVSVCFLKPFPLQFRMETPEQGPDLIRVQKYATQFSSLLKYYERTLGVKRVAPKSEFFYFRLPLPRTSDRKRRNTEVLS